MYRHMCANTQSSFGNKQTIALYQLLGRALENVEWIADNLYALNIKYIVNNIHQYIDIK